jgi:hypothetical protein
LGSPGFREPGAGDEDLVALVDVGCDGVAAVAGASGMGVMVPFRQRKPRSFVVASSLGTA